ncbi:alpha/beta fold hydrolase [Nonomuraea deserti]|uniref:Alpha/beta fold hydrolase n=1 Tax=Nonomuraea deserti TaxID=1848322 RepID=A0A4R4VW97_9ACTN|nr:alpha/beta fold hydrolase [Nonomuraea deserti]TDD04690.1 alpha/beta fold hydrolase [Nonomuraea deserti]
MRDLPDLATTVIDGPSGRIAVADHGGHGPDVVLIHGANRSLLDWEPLRRHLPEARLVAYDLRGHGHSDAPTDALTDALTDAPTVAPTGAPAGAPTGSPAGASTGAGYGWDAHLADLDAVIDALRLTDPYVIGHSLGGMIAVCHGARRPDCPGVADLDGFGGGRPELYPGLPAEEVARRRAAQTAALAAAPAVLTADQVETMIEHVRLRAQAMGIDADLEEAGARRCLTPDGPSAWRPKPGPGAQAALLAPLDGWSVFDVLRRTRCPVLLVQGGQAPPLAQLPDGFRELSEALIAGVERELATLRGPRLERVAGAGHLLHLQAPAAVGELIRTHLMSGQGQGGPGARPAHG